MGCFCSCLGIDHHLDNDDDICHLEQEDMEEEPSRYDQPPLDGEEENVEVEHISRIPSTDQQVVTLWHGAPADIQLGSLHYHTAVDVWSIGCIFSEMLNHLQQPPDGEEDMQHIFRTSSTNQVVTFWYSAPAEILLGSPHYSTTPHYYTTVDVWPVCRFFAEMLNSQQQPLDDQTLLDGEDDMKLISRTPSTDQVVTLSYRARAETLHGSPNYTTMDIWTIGCIFAEVLNHMQRRWPLFHGDAEIDPPINFFSYVASPYNEYSQLLQIFHVDGPVETQRAAINTSTKLIPHVQTKTSSGNRLISQELEVSPPVGNKFRNGQVSLVKKDVWRQHSPHRSPPSTISCYHRSTPRQMWIPVSSCHATSRPWRHLFISGFRFDTTKRELERKFSTFGHVTDVHIVPNHRTGYSRGFGFLSFEKNEEADAAIRSLHRTRWIGRTIFVEKSKSPTRFGNLTL